MVKISDEYWERIKQHFPGEDIPESRAGRKLSSCTKNIGCSASDPLDEELREEGIKMEAPYKKNRKKPKTQDGRELRRYKRRWKVPILHPPRDYWIWYSYWM